MQLLKSGTDTVPAPLSLAVLLILTDQRMTNTDDQLFDSASSCLGPAIELRVQHDP